MFRWLLYGLLAAFFMAISVILSKLSIKSAHPLFLGTVLLTLSSLFLIVMNIYSRSFTDDIRMLTTFNGLLLVFAGIANGISWIFYLTALKYGSASKVITISRLSIVFTLILCSITLCEKITIQSYIGAAFIIFGAYLIGIV